MSVDHANAVTAPKSDPGEFVGSGSGNIYLAQEQLSAYSIYTFANPPLTRALSDDFPLDVNISATVLP